MEAFTCRLKEQGFSAGSCLIEANGKRVLACQATLKHESGQVHRLITSVHLSRPENYLSIYQSGCNFSCKKCHSWYFSKQKDGTWYTPKDLLKKAISYEKSVNLIEPKSKATAWHAHDTCRCCGRCVLYGERPSSCPGILKSESIVMSPQGFGPVRNIVAFTGGDLTCCPEFYGEFSSLVHAHTKLWVLVETNGFGLTEQHLDYYRASGVDAFWLDIKAYDDNKHKWLTGCSNQHILRLPEEILNRDFTLEVLSLYIPGLVESEELENIALGLSKVDPTIPFTILAFFPEYRMKDFQHPKVRDIVDAYRRVKDAGLKNIRIGNVGVFVRTEEDLVYFQSHVDKGAF